MSSSPNPYQYSYRMPQRHQMAARLMSGRGLHGFGALPGDPRKGADLESRPPSDISALVSKLNTMTVPRDTVDMGAGTTLGPNAKDLAPAAPSSTSTTTWLIMGGVVAAAAGAVWYFTR
jgi:hypothetical protein